MDDIPLVGEEDNGVGNQSSEQLVKSNAVVKYSAANAPASFARLQCNTDLKTPPSNWLSSNGDLYGLNHVLSHSSGFSSFRMAHMFPDCVGEVDVVSDAENIKKLLKIPYSAGPVSMMVHRIENTLLIDEFDIHKHLLSRAESDWTWLKKFFREQILETLKNKGIFYKNNSRNALQQKSLVSKFLHYSLAESQEENVVAEAYNDSLPLRGPTLPEPPLEEGLPDSTIDHKFTRNVVWTFEDIQMLLGTDMPIFGGSTRPCISLRLRDATKPISVLTGIDYWLDNLMSNVPEVVMCYHLDGIVQKYELVKTEDLPHLPESKFSPKIIRDVAQNILSFLKANATKAGHTYWLFKGKNEDAVKLYDLTSLCSDSLEEKDQNPFTVPVAMLLYRVARNLRASQESSTSQIATIRMLLKNCIKLLTREKYPEIVLSTHYMLSDVYIPHETDPSCPHLEDIPSLPDQTEDESEAFSNSVPVRSLCLTNYKPFSTENKYQPRPPPIVGSIEERCRSSLLHVLEGLDCLQYFKINSEDAKKSSEEPKMANPKEPIPMPFPEQATDGKDKKEIKRKVKSGKATKEEKAKEEDCSLKSLLCRTNGETLPRWQAPEKVDTASWKRHLTSLLLSKACLVYSVLVEKEMEAGRYVHALKHICGVLRCSGENQALAGLMLLKAGDCLISLCREKANYFDEEDGYPEVHRPPPVPHINELNLIQKECESPLAIISSCIACYKRSQELCPNRETLKRLGNAYNELGNAYNNLAAEMVKKDEHVGENIKFGHCIMEAEFLLEKGLKVLQSINDTINTALVICNIGRLWRLKAHNGNSLGSSFDVQQKHIYSKAVESYTQALEVIGSRKINPFIWDSIAWELSTTLYIMATQYQENPHAQGEEGEREAMDLLHKALQQCDLTNDTAKLPLFQFRAASLHYRIASLSHKSIRRNIYDETKRKNKRALCELHYSKAFDLYNLLHNPVDLFRIQLERLSLSELLANDSKSNHTKIKYYEEAINYVKDCRKAFVMYEKANKKAGRKGKSVVNETSEGEDAEEIINLIEDKLNLIVRSLIKLYMSSPKTTEMAAKYKEIYRVILLKEKKTSSPSHLIKVIDQINQEVKQ